MQLMHLSKETTLKTPDGIVVSRNLMIEHFPLHFPALFRASLSMTNINYNRNNIVSTFFLLIVVVVCLNTAA